MPIREVEGTRQVTGKTDGSVRRLETNVSLLSIGASVLVAVTNLVARMQVYGDDLLAALTFPSVVLVGLAGAAIGIAGLTHSSVGRIVHVVTFFAFACGRALFTISGDLTSLVFFGLAVLVGSQYGIFMKDRRVALVGAMAVYAGFMAYGTYSESNTALFGAVVSLIGAGFIAYLFVVIASVRLREMENRQIELARLVAERTKDLQEEADRRRLAENEARAAAERNETLAGDRAVLLRELHHRSKNDLQMILSLMSLRAEKGDHPELAELFRPTQDRIRAIALVHEQLDSSERFDAIGLRDYLQNLLTHIQVSHREYEVTVRAEIDAEVAIKLESATHIGLVVHELVLCSYRYSFTPGTKGLLNASAFTEGDTLRIELADNGRGIPETVDPDSPDADEIAIVSGLIRRMEATLTLENEGGARWTLTIPLAAIQQTAKPVPISS